MDTPGTSSSSSNEQQEECLICGRPATCRNYGVVTCNACKMFFRRMNVEYLTYTCKRGNGNCFDNSNMTINGKMMCRECRFQKCLEAGMEFVPRTKTEIVELKNNRDDDLTKLVNRLVAMDESRVRKLYSFYTEDDIDLTGILSGMTANAVKKGPQQVVPPGQWSFIASYNLILSYMTLEFVNELSSSEKETVFKYSISRSMLLCSAIKAMRNNRKKLVNPDGQPVYPNELAQLFPSDPTILERICCLVVARVIDLKVTNEEFVLLDLLFFCNPASLHENANACSVLTAHRNKYASALLQYCQLKYQHYGPSRFTDLLSIFHVINKNYEDLTFVMMMCQCRIPSVKIKKLTADLFELATDERMKTRKLPELEECGPEKHELVNRSLPRETSVSDGK